METKKKKKEVKINLEPVKIDIKTMNDFMDIGKNQQSFLDAAYGIGEKYATSDITSKLARPAIDLDYKIKDHIADISISHDKLAGSLSDFDNNFLTVGKISGSEILNSSLATSGMIGKIQNMGVAGIIDQRDALSKMQSVTDLLDKDILSIINLDYTDRLKTLGTAGESIDFNLLKSGAMSSPAYMTVNDVMDRINFKIPKIDLNLAKGISTTIQDFVEKNPINEYKINKAFDVLARSNSGFNSALDLDNYLDENLNVNDAFTFEEIKGIAAKWHYLYIKFNNNIADKFQKFKRNNFVIYLMLSAIGSLYAKPVMEELAKPMVEKTVTTIKTIVSGEDKNTITIDKDSKVQIIDEDGDYYKVIYTNEKGEEVVCPVEKEYLQLFEEK